jgi:hypothetical protein
MLAETIDNINYDNIVMNDPVKNSIIQYSNFYKINYTNSFIVFNGIYILLNIKDDCNFDSNKLFFDKKHLDCDYNKIYNLENYILNAVDSIKKKNYKITDLVKSNMIKYSLSYNNYENVNNYNNPFYKNGINNEKTPVEKSKKLILKISGVWETKENIGITFKFILTNSVVNY